MTQAVIQFNHSKTISGVPSHNRPEQVWARTFLQMSIAALLPEYELLARKLAEQTTCEVGSDTTLAFITRVGFSVFDPDIRFALEAESSKLDLVKPFVLVSTRGFIEFRKALPCSEYFSALLESGFNLSPVLTHKMNFCGYRLQLPKDRNKYECIARFRAMSSDMHRVKLLS